MGLCHMLTNILVQSLWEVGRSNDDNPFVWFEPVKKYVTENRLVKNNVPQIRRRTCQHAFEGPIF